MDPSNRKGMGTAVAAVAMIVLLVVGAGLGYYVGASGIGGGARQTSTVTSTAQGSAVTVTSTVTPSGSGVQTTSSGSSQSGGSACPSGSTSSSGSPTSVNWIIDFTPAGHVAPLYTAVDKGFYSQLGLSVSVISNPQGSAGAVQAVSAGKADFGDADFGTLLNSMAKGNITNVRVIGAYYKGGGGAGVIYLTGPGKTINSPKDLEGKTIGSFSGNADETLFTVFAKNAGVNMSKVNIQHVSVSAMEPGLLSGQFDAILFFKQHLAELTPLAQGKGQGVAFFDYQDYGMKNLLQLSVITRTDVIQNNPALVCKVLLGFYQGVQYALKNPQDAAQSTVKQTTGLNYTITLQQWQLLNPYLGDATTIENYKNPLMIGWIDPTVASQATSIVSQAYGIPAPPASSTYTDQFVVQPSP